MKPGINVKYFEALALAALIACAPVTASGQKPTSPQSASASAAQTPTGNAAALVAQPVPAKPAPTKLEPSNPYGIAALWAQSDAVARAVLSILALMSMGTWYVMVTKLLEQSRMGRQARTADKQFWSADSVFAGVQALEVGSPFRFIAESGLEATRKHDGLHGKIEFHEWVALSVDKAVTRVQRHLQSGLALLATVGSTAPFIGLFGTVWGIYHALTAIGVAGQASIDKVAGPVGEALIMTAIGLAVAVPAVLGYNWLVRRNVLVNDDLQDFGDELHTVLLAGAGAGK